MFSPYLAELHRNAETDAMDDLLIKAISSEPYLLAEMVSLANSATHGIAGRYFYSAYDCLLRVGFKKGLSVAYRYFIRAGLNDWITQNETANQIWHEACFTAQLAKEITSQGKHKAMSGYAYLLTLLSYLGELFLVGPGMEGQLFSENIGDFANCSKPDIDVVWITLMLLKKLELPNTLEKSICSAQKIAASFDAKEDSVAAILLVARGLAQTYYTKNKSISSVSPTALECAWEQLSFSMDEQSAVKRSAIALRKSYFKSQQKFTSLESALVEELEEYEKNQMQNQPA